MGADGCDLTARTVVKLVCVTMLAKCGFHAITCVVYF
jgi:hypothetical protein